MRFLVGNVFRNESDLELERPRVAKKDNLRARRSLEVGAYDLAVRLAEDGSPVLLEAFFHRGELALARGREGAKNLSACAYSSEVSSKKVSTRLCECTPPLTTRYHAT